MYVSSEYSGRPFIPYLDELAPVVREDTGPFRMPISDKYKVNIVSCDVHIMHSHAHCMIITTTFFLQDMGTVVLGKVESGGVMKGASLLLMPNRVSDCPSFCYQTQHCM